MSTRRKARRLALQILFQWDVQGSTHHWLDEFWGRQDVSGDVQQFADQLVAGVIEQQKDIDQLIGSHATNWTLKRMPIVDRNILRMSLYELIWLPEVPAKVTMNEAIELAKTFADDQTRRFVNGILDHVLKEEVRLEAKRAELAAEASGR